MRFLLMLFAFFLCAVVVLGVLSFQYGGVWGLVGFCALVVACLFFLPALLKVGLKLAFVRMLRKGLEAVVDPLKGATTVVHEVRPIPEPDYYRPEWDPMYAPEDESPTPLEWYEVDITITPADSDEQEAAESEGWQVASLMSADPKWKPMEVIIEEMTKGFDEEESDEDELSMDEFWTRGIHRYWIEHHGTSREVVLRYYRNEFLYDDDYTFSPEVEEPLHGEQRLRLEVSVPVGTREFLIATHQQALADVVVPPNLEHHPDDRFPM